MHRKEFWQIHDTQENRSADRTALHRAYYAQYVQADPYVCKLVLARIGRKALKESTDPHLNDIPLAKWDAMVRSLPYSVVQALKANGDWLSLGTGVCILKEAARQILEQACKRFRGQHGNGG